MYTVVLYSCSGYHNNDNLSSWLGPCSMHACNLFYTSLRIWPIVHLHDPLKPHLSSIEPQVKYAYVVLARSLTDPPHAIYGCTTLDMILYRTGMPINARRGCTHEKYMYVERA